MIGLGVVTYNRPQYFDVCIHSVLRHLEGVVDHLIVCNDASDLGFRDHYASIYRTLPAEISIYTNETNQGVCKSKNLLLQQLYVRGCDYLFILEDDQEILSSKAVTEYIAWSEKTDCHHFGFAHHGPANAKGYIEVAENGLEIYPNCVGAYTFFTRKVIDTVGYMDESFDRNAHEHCEYTARIGKAGLCPPFWRFPDIPHSREYLREQPGAINNSAIRQGPAWPQIVEVERRKFAEKHPDVWS